MNRVVTAKGSSPYLTTTGHNYSKPFRFLILTPNPGRPFIIYELSHFCNFLKWNQRNNMKYFVQEVISVNINFYVSILENHHNNVLVKLPGLYDIFRSTVFNYKISYFLFQIMSQNLHGCLTTHSTFSNCFLSLSNSKIKQ